MADRKKRAPKSRSRIIETKAKLARKGATAAEIIATVREKYPEIIRAEKEDLIELGLMTIVNSVCNLNWGSGSKIQADFFEGYDVPRTVTLREHDKANGGTRIIKKNLDALTKGELRQYIAGLTRTPPKQSRRTLELTRFFEVVDEHGAEDWTVRECWKAACAQVALARR